MAFAIRNIFFVIFVLAEIVTASATESNRPRRNVGTCGFPKTLTGLIVRGQDTKRGEFPWVVALMFSETQPPQFLCGGTLISSTFVVSVAHCIQEKHSTRQFLLEEVLAIFGVHRLDDPYEVDRVVLRPQEIIVHEDWNPNIVSYDADISLLKFDEGRININHAYINPICIWDSIDDPLANEGVVLGWGKTEDLFKKHETVPKLMKVEIQSNEECLPNKPALAALSSTRTFCASNKNGSGVCHGDSGIGLFIKIDGVYYLKGLVSSALMNYEGSCDISSPAVYTNIHKFLDWIKQKTRGANATSAKALIIDVFCTFQPQFSYHHSRRIQTCVFKPKIDSDFFVIRSEPSTKIRGFAIHDKRHAKFLPRYIGETFPKLEEVTAYNCSLSIIRSFYFDNMRNVRYLDLSSNQITVIEKGSFKDLYSVKYLFLGDNRIDTLDKDLFKTLINLKDLDLAHNRINSLDPRTFVNSGGNLLEVNLLSNACINENYDSEQFDRLETDLRTNCPYLN